MIPNNRSVSPLQMRIIYVALFVCLCFFLAGIIGISIVITVEKNLSDKIYPDIYLDGVDIGGKTKAEARALLADTNTDLSGVTITTLYQNTPIATYSAQTLNLHVNTNADIDRAFLVARTPRVSSRIYQKIVTLLHLHRYDFVSNVEYDDSPFQELLLDTQDQYNIPAKNALFNFENGRVSSFRPDEKGLKINGNAFLVQVASEIATLKTNPRSLRIPLTDSVVEPEIRLQDANSFGIKELIGEGQSDYSGSIPERIHNIILATSKFNGVLIPKDTVFSFTHTVGDISSQTGYVQAYIIKNGRTVLGDGGGVCQVSTTMFRAAMNSGLPIIERNAHAYRVHYYENDQPPGFDATIFAPSVDLQIKNDTPAYILIQTNVDEANNIVHFRFYGEKDGRSTQYSDIKLYDQQPPPPPLYQDDFTLAKGVVKQVDFAAWGAKASFVYTVMRNGQQIEHQTFFSDYRPWQAVYLVGQM